MFKKLKSLFSPTPAPTTATELPAWAQTPAITEVSPPVEQLTTETKVKKPRAPRKSKKESKPADPPINAEKLAANAAGEPWVSVLGMDLDLANLSSGSFNLDWNDIFVARLIKAGYKGKSDVDIVDQWFQDICRNVVLETYQQDQADPANRK
jgi:hypothetical protein